MIYSRTIRSVAISTLLATCGTFLQPANAADHDAGFWTVFSTTDSLPSDASPARWHYWFDAQARYFDIGTRLIISLEPFVDLRDTDWGSNSGPAQNRTFVGMGWRVSDKLTIEAGYIISTSGGTAQRT